MTTEFVEVATTKKSAALVFAPFFIRSSRTGWNEWMDADKSGRSHNMRSEPRKTNLSRARFGSAGKEAG